MNKDIPALMRVRYVMHDMQALEERVAWQRERLVNITQHYSDMPRGGGPPKGFAEAFAKLSELEERQAARLLEYADAIEESERLLCCIESDDIRQLARLLYVERLPPMRIRRAMRISEKRMRLMRETVEMAHDMESVCCQHTKGD